MFGGIQDADTIRLELRRVEQEEVKSVDDYALQVQTLQQKLLSLYDYSVSMRQGEKEYQKSRTRQESLECFLYGLRDPPEYRVSSKKPTTLRKAANIAVNLEGRSKVLQRHENCASKPNKNIATLHIVNPQTGSKYYNNSDSEAPNLQNADLGNLWALLASATANVKTATVAKLECIFCKGSHQVQNCQKLFKAIESGGIPSEEKMQEMKNQA